MNGVFWSVMSCSLIGIHWHFRRTCCFHLQGIRCIWVNLSLVHICEVKFLPYMKLKLKVRVPKHCSSKNTMLYDLKYESPCGLYFIILQSWKYLTKYKKKQFISVANSICSVEYSVSSISSCAINGCKEWWHIATCTEFFCSICVPQYGDVQSFFYNCEEGHIKNMSSFSVFWSWDS